MQQQLDIFTDYAPAKAARDAALSKVESNSDEWMRLAYLQLEQIARGNGSWVNLEHGFTGESLRKIIEPLVGRPHSRNCYGALVMKAVRRKLIFPTGRYLPMQDETSHYRKTPEYTFQRVV